MALTDRRHDRIGPRARVLPGVMQGRAGLFVAVACACFAMTASAAAAAKPPPPKFFGVDAWSNPSAPEFARMGQGKVGVYRMFLNWAEVEPCRGCRDWNDVDRGRRRGAESRQGAALRLR